MIEPVNQLHGPSKNQDIAIEEDDVSCLLDDPRVEQFKAQNILFPKSHAVGQTFKAMARQSVRLVAPNKPHARQGGLDHSNLLFGQAAVIVYEQGQCFV
jgi:hypothetical protein